ncbi:hypothetical protein SLS62_009751 [Diatrype stigma]|uniref:Store-operated calcium entry-associated regulatory factor n=1 Tax=Diatrype stigma TaxID=117547 RepID=A0AAN9ULP8_9PEZI
MHLTCPSLLPILLAIATLTPTPTLAAKSSKPPKSPSRDAILLSDVETLTLRAGRPTTHRRVSAIPQLKCVSPPAICRLHEPEVMRCTNAGGGYGGREDAAWSCTAPLPPELRLGSTDVVCEGYGGPDDPYVLRGSCGVEYRLALTERGEERFPELVGETKNKNKKGGQGGGGLSWEGGRVSVDDDYENDKIDWSGWLFGVVFIAVALWILVSACSAANPNGGDRVRRAPRRGGGGGGGGGFWPGGGGGGDGYGGGGWDDPPPPYPGTKPSYSPAAHQAGQGWRPGFWTGLAGGGAAGYAAANMAGNRTTNNNSRLRNNDYGGGGGSSSWGSSSRSGGGGGGGGSASTSTDRYESTGFGSTSRR